MPTKFTTQTLAVLDDSTVYTYNYALTQHGRFAGSRFPIESLNDILLMCHLQEINTLWICPGSRVSQEAKAIMERRHGAEVSEKSTIDRDGTPRFLLVHDLETTVKVAWPEWDDRWPWRRCTDANTLLHSLLYLQDALQAKVEWSPGRTGQKLMGQFNKKHPTWLDPVELPDVVKTNTAVDMKWKRELTDEEQQPGMWMHAFDAYSKYLAACTSANLGEGSPIHVEKFGAFNPSIAGLWRVGDEWLWTPELELLLAEYPGKRAAIAESWQWPKSHQALRAWGEHMWKARQALRHPRGNTPNAHACDLAFKAVKMIYVQAMGWLTFERPDHWSMIVSGAYRSTAFKKRQMEQQGFIACFWNADMLCFIIKGAAPQPLKSMLNRDGLLGGYKHVGSAPITPELAATFAEEMSWETCHTAVLAALEGVKV